MTTSRVRIAPVLLLMIPLFASATHAADGITLRVRRGVLATDQANLASSGSLAVSWQQSVGQELTVGAAGELAGIEFAPLLDTADTTDTVSMDVEVPLYPTVTISILTAGFPPGAGSTPAGLSSTGFGPGYANLSSFHLAVSAGDVVRFTLRPGWAHAVCDTGTHHCTVGRVGTLCFDNIACEKEARAGESGNSYEPGAAILNGTYQSFDIAFKTVVRTTGLDGVTLDWSGGAPGYTGYRSLDPATITSAGNAIGSTSGLVRTDVPPAGVLWFYEVLGH